VELAAGGVDALGKIETMPDVNVVHSDLTVPESATQARPAYEEPRPPEEETTLRSFLWILSGALLFMWVFYRFGLLGRRTS
jgi:hypothetical protein